MKNNHVRNWIQKGKHSVLLLLLFVIVLTFSLKLYISRAEAVQIMKTHVIHEELVAKCVGANPIAAFAWLEGSGISPGTEYTTIRFSLIVHGDISKAKVYLRMTKQKSVWTINEGNIYCEAGPWKSRFTGVSPIKPHTKEKRGRE